MWLPEGHLAFFIIDLVQTLDLSDIYARYQKDLRGYPPYHPEMMVGLLLYGYCTGMVSSRKLEMATYEDVATRVIAGGQHPDHTRISEFRRVHLKPLSALFVQVLQLCAKAGMVKLGHVALDGTKVEANASKHKAMSYDRMNDEIARLQEKVADLLKSANATDADEDRKYGKKRRGDELPDELARTETRLARIKALKAELEAEAKEQAEAKERAKAKEQAKAKNADGKDDDGPPDPPELPSHRIPTDGSGKPTGKAQRNFTDPDSRIMKMGDKSFDQAYNCQAAVDADSQIIVARSTVNAANDKQQLKPMVEQIKKNLRGKPKKLSADSGYYSEDNVRYLRGRRIDDYLCPDRLKHGEKPPAVRGRIPENLSFSDRVRRKLNTQRGRRIYGKRKGAVEPVFGQIKHARRFRQFLLRGLQKADGEWSLWCTTHNLLKLWAAQPA
jgi:transposase